MVVTCWSGKIRIPKLAAVPLLAGGLVKTWSARTFVVVVRSTSFLPVRRQGGTCWSGLSLSRTCFLGSYLLARIVVLAERLWLGR